MISIQKNISLAPFTTYNIGGPANFFVKVSTIEELIDAIKFAKNKNLQYFILGEGANILISDKGFNGLVIKNESKKIVLDKHNSENYVLLTVDSGATIKDVIEYTKERELSGFEHFAGIPSSIGGALWQNLHFLSSDRSRTVFIAEIVENSEILQVRNDKPEFMERKLVDVSYFKFGYDYSILHDNKDIVLKATFKLTLKAKAEIEKIIKSNLAWRSIKHPDNSVKTSAGSVFKKIEGYGAGRLIEKVGLKGYSIGGAMVSPKHANFIVNTGNATANDVKTLIDLIKKKIKQELGLNLETEISLVGEF